MQLALPIDPAEFSFHYCIMGKDSFIGEPLIFHVSGNDVRPVTNAPNIVLRGVAIPDDPRVLVGAVRKAIVDGWYESAEANELKNLISEGERILEIGSAIGFMSTLMARDRRVSELLCFEANPKLIDFSRRVHELNNVKGVRVENAILTTDPSLKEVKFYLRDQFWSSSTSPKWGYQGETMVPTRQLFDVLADFKPSMIVCDIEGGEVDLFENADLAGIRSIMLEIHTEIVGRAAIRKLFDAMSRNNLVYDQKASNHNVVSFRRIE